MKEQYLAPQIILRNATNNDIDDMVGIRRAAWLATYPNEEAGFTFEDIKAKVDKDLSLENQLAWADRLTESNETKKWIIAEVNGSLVGYIFVHKINGVPVVQALNVHPDYFGAGIGQALLNSGIEWLGEGDIELGVFKHNARAIKFYEKNGFTIDGEAHDKVALLPSGQAMPEWRMVRKAT
jgi:ribosomal protein S18 acetylase RimI-like enzyme